MKLGAAHQCDRDRFHDRRDLPEVPGYRLLERLEGMSEVWSAEGPGGFPVALRIVRANKAFDLDALQAVLSTRRPRHPNLQTSFGSWRVGSLLILAVELPDGSLWDRFRASVSAGLPGCPRDDLIEALSEAARAIDYLNTPGILAGPEADPFPTDAGCPHGDVAPRSLLFVGGGLKVADIDPFRWLRSPDGPHAAPAAPDYAAPERLAGRMSRHSDQFSLAATYSHLLTGRLVSLSEPGSFADVDRPALARALHPDPDHRWPSCRAFVDALRASATAPPPPPPPSGENPVEIGIEPADFMPHFRPLMGLSKTLALAAATGAATLAGTLWVRNAPSPPRGRSARNTSKPQSDPAPAVPAAVLANQVAPPSRPRLQNPTDKPPVVNLEQVGPGLPSTGNRSPLKAMGSDSGSLSGETAIPVERTPEPMTPVASDAIPAGTGSTTAPIPPPSGPRVAGPPLVSSPPAPDSSRRPEAAGPRPDLPASGPEVRLEAPEDLTVQVGLSSVLVVGVELRGGAGVVSVRFLDLPPGVVSKPESITTGKLSLAVRAEADATEGSRIVRLVASSGAARTEARIKLVVRPSVAVLARRAGDAALHRGEYLSADAAYSEAIRHDPADHLAYHGRGISAYRRGDLNASLADLDNALRLQPEVPTALNNRGLVRLARRESSSAITDFDEAIRLDPSFAVARYNRGRALDVMGALDRARIDYDEAIRLLPSFPKAYRARAGLFSRLGDADRARADYKSVLRITPADTAARNNLGLLLVGKGELHRAIAEFDEAIRIDPAYSIARYNRGRVYTALGDLAEALVSFDQAIRLDPTMSRAIDARAEILSRRSDLAAARPGLGLVRRSEIARAASH